MTPPRATRTLLSAMVYLDNQATTPLDGRVLDAMMPALTGDAWANAASTHSAGVRASRLLERARTVVAAGFPPGGRRVVFTSGATEANALALLGAAPRGRRRHVVITAIEHPSVTECAKELERRGCEVSRIAPDADGIVSADEVVAAVTDRTALVACMLVNNEVGTVQPAGAVARRVRARQPDCHVHVDAVQAVGLVDLADLEGASSIAVSGHKIHGPKGVGALLLLPKVHLRPLWHGGGHEEGLRSGTVPVAMAAGLARAVELSLDGWQERAEQMRALRDELIREVLGRIAGARLVGHPTERSPANVAVAVPGVTGDALVGGLDARGFIASTGSACHGGDPGLSHVLAAMGVGEDVGVVRLGLSRLVTRDQTIDAARALAATAAELQGKED